MTLQLSVRTLTSNDKSLIEGSLNNITHKCIEKKSGNNTWKTGMYFVISEQLYMSDCQINIYNTLQLSWTCMTSIRGTASRHEGHEICYQLSRACLQNHIKSGEPHGCLVLCRLRITDRRFMKASLEENKKRQLRKKIVLLLHYLIKWWKIVLYMRFC